MPFQSLRNIDLAFKQTRIMAFAVLVFCLIVSTTSLVVAYRTMETSKNRVYVVEQGKSLIAALRTNVAENRPVEAQEHVKRFHELFFTLPPDDDAIKNNINEALFLADESARREYNNMKEKGFFSQLISGSVSLEINVDSVYLNLNVYPYYAKTFATQKVIRETRVTERNLNTECYLRNTSRSENNPHGFIIERWTILNNSDKRTYNR